MQLLSRGAGFSAMLFLAACGTTGQGPDRGPVPIEKDPDYTDVSKPSEPTSHQPTAPTQPRVSGAAQSLVSKAQAASNQGDYEQAIALLERAQRIDADSGEIYLALAQTYKAKGDLSMASAAAERGMLYCSGNTQCGALRALIN